MNHGILLLGCLLFAICCAQAQSASLGIFDGHSDIGAVLHSGAATFDASKNVYTVAGSGADIWDSPDDFHFVWKKVTGDFALTAEIELLTKSDDPHRKAALMVRQSLDADSRYVDVALHGSTMAALQFRSEKGGHTQEIGASTHAPKLLRLVKRGDYFYMSVARNNEPLQVAAGSPRIQMKGAFYVGLAVCAHDRNLVREAAFSKVAFANRSASDPNKAVLYSVLETIAPDGGFRNAVYVTPNHIEAPNWSRDGSSFLFNSNGHMYSIPATGGTPSLINTVSAIQCNNDHGISPDGNTLAISDQSQADHLSTIYTLPLTGGTPKRITTASPAYWHGWSPDGKTLAFVGERAGNFDIYTIPVEGGAETRLTTTKGLDDGPEYTPDGRRIYFNSERTGHMQIWSMKPDGSEQQQVTFGEENDWFPHFSPDGQSMVFVSYGKDVTGHPANKDVELRMMSMRDKNIRVLARLFGGQGTMNVPSWSPRGTEFAYVSYIFVDAEDAGKM